MIYQNFKVGDQISKSDAKEKLKTIYDSIGYTKTAKASDLEDWFEVKVCKIINNSSNRRDNGFELVKKKQ